jgi:hypothetical protein
VIDDSRRLHEIEALYLAMPDPSGVKLHAYLAQRMPKEGCTCGRGKKCDDGAPRWHQADGEPYALRTVQEWIQKVKHRLKGRADADRASNRAVAIARFDAAAAMAMEQESPRDLISATSRRAELDGTHLAAEEAERPSQFQRVWALMQTLEDYQPPTAPDISEPLPPLTADYLLGRAERLLLAADDASARYRQLGDPTAMSEAERLRWRRDVLDESIHQTMTSPGTSPEVRRETIIRSAGVASMITEGADLAERLAQLEKKLG